MKENNVGKIEFSKELMEKTGKIEYTLTNDFMFHVVMEDPVPLKGLVSSLLRIPKGEIVDIVVANPFEYGKKKDDKTFVLDLKVTINGGEKLNIEMQVKDLGNWENRSLSYLCRMFDSLQSGEDYNNADKCTHIGILDYDLFPEDREFYARNMIMNVKNHRIYNGNFALNVLSLNQIENATDEDKRWELDRWARIFKASTWEDLKMLAEKSETMMSAANLLSFYNENKRAIEEAREREIFLRSMKRDKDELKMLRSENKALKAQAKQLKKAQERAEKEQELAKRAQERAEKAEEENKRLKAMLEQKNEN